MNTIAKTAAAAALTLLATLAVAAPTGSDCTSADSMVNSRTDCRDASARSDDQRDTTNDSTHSTRPNDSRRQASATKSTDSLDDDDDEEACVTKAANGVCLDVDED